MDFHVAEAKVTECIKICLIYVMSCDAIQARRE